MKYEAIGGIAVARGYLTYDQLQECLQHQKDLTAQNKHKLIGMILLERGYITNDQLIELLRCRTSKKPAPEA